MRRDLSPAEPHRISTTPPWLSKEGDRFGMFVIRDGRTQIKAIVCDASDPDSEGWEHVSVSVSYMNTNRKIIHRTPTWDEMCMVKRMFFEPEECVLQFHPPESEYVNVHKHCLHLWLNIYHPFKVPPKICV